MAPEAGAYQCPSCGAAVDPKAGACPYCRAALSPVRCPWCFAWLDARTPGCPRCGASAVAPAPDARPLACPSCRGPALSARALGGARLAGCAGCGGVWADVQSFRLLCEDRATQAAYLGEGSVLPPPGAVDPSARPIVYRPCPVCADLMNRYNFAGCSGVILDACKPHGVWFDADELREIIAFIRGGGLDVARRRQLEDMEEERRRLQRAASELSTPAGGFPGLSQAGSDLDALAGGLTPAHGAIGAASGLLVHLLGL